MLASIDESSADYNYDDRYIIIDDIDNICDRNHVHHNIKAIDTIMRIHDQIKQAQSEWKGAELLAKSMGKVLHKVFKVVAKELKNY